MTEPSTEPTAEAPAEEPTPATEPAAEPAPAAEPEPAAEPVSASNNDGTTATQVIPPQNPNEESPYGSYKQRPYAVASLAFSPHPVFAEAAVAWEPPHEGQPERYVLEAAGVTLELPGTATEVYLTNLVPGSEVRTVITAYFADGNEGMLYLPAHPVTGVQNVTEEG